MTIRATAPPWQRGSPKVAPQNAGVDESEELMVNVEAQIMVIMVDHNGC